MKFLEMFIEDCKYYDGKNTEVKTIAQNINLKNKTLLDIGTGVGRLAFPLAKHAKEIIALDKDKRFKEYFRKHNNKKIKFANQSIKEFSKKPKKFDVILIAWPTFDFKIINHLKRLMHANSFLILITCDNNSDYETIVNKMGIVEKNYFDKDIKNKGKFLKRLPKIFKLIKKIKLKTFYMYPDKTTAFRIIKNGLRLWFDINLNKKSEERLVKLIDKHKKRDKVIFKEEVYFYMMKLK